MIPIYRSKKNVPFLYKQIINKFLWKKAKFLEYVCQNPNYIVLDIGSKNGLYSIFSAKLNRTVLAVEPFYDNVLEIYKATKAERLQDKIFLVHNLISEGADIQKQIHHPQSIQSQLRQYRKYPKVKLPKKHDVKAISLDDILCLVSEIQKRQNVSSKAIVKIDIDGFEPYALTETSELFKLLDVKVLFMKWNLAGFFNDKSKVEYILDYFGRFKLTPFDVRSMTPLYASFFDDEEWREWPENVVWKQVGY